MKERLAFWKKDKRRIGEKLVNTQFSIRLIDEELLFVREQAKINCCSVNSYIRKCINAEKTKVNLTQD